MLSRLRRRVPEPSAALPGATQSRLMGRPCLPSASAHGVGKTLITVWMLAIGVLSAGLWREASAQGFAPKTDFATGTQPRSVAIGDVNGDGRPDLAVANYISSTVSVLLGTGAGGFGAKTDFATGPQPYSVAIGDVSGDGRPDLAVANAASSTVSVLLGTGAGGFGAKTDFATGSIPISVAIGDVSGDGRPDLAVANANSNTVSVLLGNGDGGFGAKTDFATGSSPYSVAIGEVNGDGRPDLAVANFSSSTVSMLLGTGAGGFGAKTDFATGTEPYSVAIGDLDGNGRPDLAVANVSANTVSVLLNTYPPPPRVFGPKIDYTTGNNPQVVAIGDLNGDSVPDLAVANTGNFSGNTVSVLLGAGAGSFGAKTDFTTGSGPTAVAIGDLNVDGKPDLAVSNFGGAGSVSVLLGTGGGSFGAKTDFTTDIVPNFVAIGDLNGDGKPDLVSASGLHNTVSVLLGTGTGSFGAKTDFATGGSPRCVVIADLNGDGKLDVATANNATANVSVLLGTGTGSLGAKTDFTTASNPIWVAVGDLNADGRPDLAAATAGAASASVLLGTGGGSFGPKTDFAAGGGPQSVAIADLDADGKLDLAVACSGKVSVLIGNGAGSFAPRTEFPTGLGQNGVAIADLNGDGWRDLAVTAQGSNKVSVLLNTVDTTSPTVHLNAPNGGGTIITGSVTNITWTASDDYVVDHVDLYYSLDGGTNYTLIVANRPNSGSYGWSVPTTTTSAGRVKVVAFDGSGHSAEDASDANFNIFPGISINDVSVAEPNAGTTSVSFTVSLSNPPSQPVTVSYQTQDGTATLANNDYVYASGTVSIPQNVSSATLTVLVNGDLVYEPDETFTLVLSNPVNGSLIDASGQCTIQKPPTLDSDFWVVDGSPSTTSVNATLLVGDTLYIGGYFIAVGPNTGSGVPLDATTGLPPPTFPKVYASSGLFTVQVLSVIPDGSGGWYIGGRFSSVGGQPRNNLAHILPDNSLANWNPGPSGTGEYLWSLALKDGILYVGGQFLSIGGQPRNGIAALDATTGVPTAWNPGTGTTYALAVHGSLVYAGGPSSLKALDVTTGLATSWNPNPNNFVYAIAVDGNTVYAGGSFTAVAGQSRNRIAAIDSASGLATSWNPDASAIVNSLVVSGGTVYVGGGFATIGGQSRSGLAVLDAATGAATPWDPSPNPGASVGAIAIDGNTVYVAGGFTTMGGQPRRNLAAIDATSGLATSWDPRPGSGLYCLAVAGGKVYAGGSFRTMGGYPRDNIAAIDVKTGLPTSWNPGASSTVNALAIDGSVLYVGGGFQSLGGQPRQFIGALDAATGIATAWDPHVNVGTVFALAVNGSTVYAAGDFLGVGGQFRNNIAALDATTGHVTSWNPNASNAVRALFVNGNTVYAGGDFTSIGGQSRNRLAALDATTGLASAWNPNANNSLYALYVNQNTVYAGGNFTSIGGQSRNRLAALDAATGLATGWNPNANSSVRAFAVRGNSVYVGGDFTTIGGQSRGSIAEVDATTALPTAWNPSANGVQALAVSDSVVFAGGGFTQISGTFMSGLAAIGQLERPPSLSIADVSVPEGDSGTTNATLTITLSKKTSATVTVDYQVFEGTATLANGDFESVSGTATIDPKTFTGAVTVPIHGDLVQEGNETFTVRLTNATNAVLTDSVATCTILNDDGVPGLSINDVTIAEGDTGSVSAVFTVRLSHPTDQPVRVLFQTHDGSATVADNDYVAASDTVVIPAKGDSATISVSVTGDLAHEPVETFSVVLSDPVNATIADSAGIGTIANDDPDTTPPAIPAPFTGVFSGGPVQLHWGANTEPDFALYHLHRDTTEDFVPGPGNLVVSQPDTGYVDAGSTWSYYKLSALDSTGNQSGFALLVPSSQAAGATLAGTNVPVSLPPVHLTFQNVTGSGVTSLTTQTGGQAPPNGLKVAPGSPKIYYQLTTTASFTGTVTVCTTYDPAHVSGQESNLKLMHFDTAQVPPKWMEVTTSVNVDSNVICGTVTHFSEFALMETDPTVDVKDEIPSTVQLYPCVPNPVSGTALIRFDLPVVAPVRLGLFDLQGRLVRELERRATKGPGRYAVQWDGRGDHGERLQTGVYFLRLEAGAFRQVRRVALIN